MLASGSSISMRQNSMAANVVEPPARLTRARAASLHAPGLISQSKAPSKQNKKQVSHPNPKPNRVSTDENGINANEACVQRKRRAVFQDVTNVCCQKTYRSCYNASKIQTKSGKLAKKDQANKIKVNPSVRSELTNVKADLKKKCTQEVKKEIKSRGVLSTIIREENLPLCLTTLKSSAKYDFQFESRCFQMTTEVKSPSKKDNGKLSCDVITSRCPDIINIDAYQKDPQMCSSYAPDIYNNLHVAELARRPLPTFIETTQRDVTPSMRGILVDWLVEVSEEYKLVPDTLYLTVYLIDWFLSQTYIERHRLQLLGVTCLLISSKYEEICAPRVEEFCFITDNTYTKEEVLKMESQVLNCCRFQLFAPTAKSFLRRFLRAAQASYNSPSLELEYLANYLAELTLVDYSFLNFLPSVIAASAVFFSRWTLDQSSHPWNPTLEYYTSYKAPDLKSTVFALQDLQLNTKGCFLSAIRMKYKQEKFKSVAALSSPTLLDTLF